MSACSYPCILATTQDWFRRLTLRGKYSDDEKDFIIDVVDGQKLYNPNQRAKMGAGTITKKQIIDILDKVDTAFGKWASKPNTFRVRIIVEDTSPEYPEWVDALQKYTLWTPVELMKSIRDRRSHPTGHVAKKIKATQESQLPAPEAKRSRG